MRGRETLKVGHHQPTSVTFQMMFLWPADLGPTLNDDLIALRYSGGVDRWYSTLTPDPHIDGYQIYVIQKSLNNLHDSKRT